MRAGSGAGWLPSAMSNCPRSNTAEPPELALVQVAGGDQSGCCDVHGDGRCGFDHCGCHGSCHCGAFRPGCESESGACGGTLNGHGGHVSGSAGAYHGAGCHCRPACLYGRAFDYAVHGCGHDGCPPSACHECGRGRASGCCASPWRIHHQCSLGRLPAEVERLEGAEGCRPSPWALLCAAECARLCLR